MPPRIPRLTLFTGGPACTLCTTAKAALLETQKRTPFHLSLYDIRKVPNEDYDRASDRTAWRRLYQYDIPVLHRASSDTFESLSGREGTGGRVMKHRIDQGKLEALIKRWTAEMNEEDEKVESNLKRSRSNSAEDRTPIKRARPASPSPPLTDDEPPFFIIDTEPSTISDDSHYESFGRGFSYSYIESPHASTPHLHILGDPLSPQLSPTKSTRCCFNCSSELHISSACPLPRNPELIATNRLAFQAEGGGSGDGGKLGGNDTERVRKMGFAEVFRPGVVSAELRAALGYGYESEGEEGRVIDWPWYWRFNEWGYPKGWVMMGDQRHPAELVKDRIGRETEWSSIEMLKVFDGEGETSFAPLGDTNVSPIQIPTVPLPTIVDDLPPLDSTFPLEPLPPALLPPPPPADLPPPPPDCPPPPRELRLVYYPTTLFDSNLLTIHRPQYPYRLPTLAEEEFYRQMVPIVRLQTVEQGVEGEPESEMDISSGDEY